MRKLDKIEKMNLDLLNRIPKDQIDKVFKQYYCDIEPTFLGFVETYFYLSKLIPKNYTVIDFGCAFNAQSFYFTKHKKYIAIDEGKYERFCAPNCIIYENTKISKFIYEHIKEFDLNTTFAICNYVPSDEEELVRKKFKNVFVYYPSGYTAEMFKNYNNEHEDSIAEKMIQNQLDNY